MDEVYGAALGTLLGAWVGAIPIPLDWDREWQKWPVTIVTGAYIGFAAGKLAGEALNSVANRQIRRLNLEVYLSRLGRGANHTKDIVSAIGNGHQLRRLVIFYNVSGCTPAEVEGWMSVFKDVKIYGKVTIRRFGTKRRLALSKTKKAWLIESVQCRREATSQVYSQSTGFQHPVPEQPCHFLRIPAELRLMIYRLLLKPESQSIPLTDRYDCGFSRGVGILRVSHLIYQEASDVLYGENSFHVLCLPHFYLNYPKVLKFVADRQMRRLKLVVRFAQKERDIRSIQEIVSILNSAHCLKDLTIYYQTFHLLTRFCTPAGLEQRLMLFKDLKIHGKVTIECDPELDPEVRTRLIKSMQMPGQDNRSSFIRKIEEPAPLR
ncbi:Glycosylphosphatidylinositol (GPI) anchor assembly protein [Coniosporium tulheliwenetii]|uniref:Glycosylphosphatidylinositol (GPI) anchor assembly protein n=1 Tax=Coniosporium tulheliwenetii TaxID=3383036 RepID=A0ACC2YQW6_9PEZI|nr:Glycosylphosphatidylinositol (GPI) anchor assembly protein [Cladosporium sp. JES 115]